MIFFGVAQLSKWAESGRWVGDSNQIGSDMCAWIVSISGVALANISVQHITNEDYMYPDIKAHIDKFKLGLAIQLDDTSVTTHGWPLPWRH